MTTARKAGLTLATAGIMIGATVAMPATASASDIGTKNCGTGSFYTVEKVGARYYKATAAPAGKYNASKSSSTLKYTVSISTSRSSGWSAGGGLSVKVAIVEINAAGDYHVTKSNTKGISVTDTLNVPGKHYGYVTPKAEYQKFHILKQHYGANCKVKTDKDYGIFAGITAAVFWSECVGKSSCTPKP